MKKWLCAALAVLTALSLCACNETVDPYKVGPGTVDTEKDYVILPETVKDDFKYDNKNGDYYYAVYGRHAEITRYVGTDKDVSLPTGLDNRPVTVIAEGAFADRLSVTAVNVPDTVTTIGAHAFERCRGLRKITGCQNLTSIGTDAFAYDENLVDFPWTGNKLANIGSYAFTWCTALSSVTIPASCDTIGNYAFRCCSALANLTFEDGALDSVGEQAFFACTALQTLVYPNIRGECGESIFGQCTALVNVTFDPEASGISIRAFQGCSALRQITIPRSITSIGAYAFGSCTSLVRVTVSGDMTSIGSHAFLLVDDLTIVGIKGSATEYYVKNRADGKNWTFQSLY